MEGLGEVVETAGGMPSSSWVGVMSGISGEGLSSVLPDVIDAGELCGGTDPGRASIVAAADSVPTLEV